MSEKEEASSVIASSVAIVPSIVVSSPLNPSFQHSELLPASSSSTEHSSAISPPPNKRQNTESVSDLCAFSENKPLCYLTKRQKIMSGSDQMEPSTDSTCADKQDYLNGLSKKASITTSGLPQQPSAHNPLCERNIRVENDHSNALNKNTSYDKNSSRLPDTNSTVLNSKQSYCENNSESNSNALINLPNTLDNTHSSSLNNNITNGNSKSNTSNSSQNSPLAVNDTPLILNSTNTLSKSATVDNSNTTPEANSLTSAITSLENSHPQLSPSTSTLDYVAQLPDGYGRQSIEGLDDVSATPPHIIQHSSVHQSYSGDEDDDNYLDSSDEEDGEDGADTTTNNDEDESCGEDDGSVVSTVGSTCSLRSVASEALAAICRNERGQTTNQDGSLLYNCTPSAQPLPAFSPSLFSHVPPAIKFCQHNEVCRPLPECVSRLLKWRYTPITPLIIRKTVVNSGYKMTKRTIMWSGTWGKHMKSTGFKSVRSYQKMNHFPGTFQIGRKDKLWNNFLRLQAKFGKEEFGFMPKTFILPAEMKALKTAFDKEGVKKKWIVKPPASARGTGIQVVHKWSQLDMTTPLVVQRYVSRPYLINNTKFDLRIYVMVTSFHPLRIYLYQDGLVRFASVEYRNVSTSLSDRFMHLTNYSVNKTNSSYTHNTEAGQCQGHRWTLCTLWGYLKAQGVDTGALWSRIADMVIKTVLSGEHDIIVRARKNLRSKYSCFELFGFDVLLDEKLRPWLLEVNISPSLHSACSLDFMVKGPLVAQLLTMASFHVPDHRTLTPQMQTEVLTDCQLSARVNRLTLDHRLYTRLLTDVEQSKHTYINSLSRPQYLTAALDTLTPDDVRHLILGEDEIHRAGKFTCIFPTEETHQYFGFLDKPRYYNRLWDAWETAYGSCREKGIERLEKLCAEKYHLIVPPKFKMPKVVGAPAAKPPGSKEDSICLTTSCSTSSETATITISSTSATSVTEAAPTSTLVDAPAAQQTVVSQDRTDSVNNNDTNTTCSGESTSDNSGDSSVNSITTSTDTGAVVVEALQSETEQSDATTTTNSSSGSGGSKRPLSATRPVCKKSRMMRCRRARRPHLKVHPTKPAECTAFLTAALVSGGRGTATHHAADDEEEEEEDCDWDEEQGDEDIQLPVGDGISDTPVSVATTEDCAPLPADGATDSSTRPSGASKEGDADTAAHR